MNSRPRLYARRWPILIAFCLINTAIQILWICYAPVADLAAKEYGVQRWWIDFLPMLFMLVYLPFSIPASWAIDTWGFSRSVGLGAILTALAGIGRALFPHSFALNLTFTLVLSLAQPLLLNAYTKFAALWFPLHQRATIVGIAFLSLFVGVAIGEALTPLLVLQDPQGMGLGLASAQWIYAVFTVVSVLFFVLVVRDKPLTPPGPTHEGDRALVLDGLRSILRNPNVFAVMLALFVASGLVNGLGILIDDAVIPKGHTPDEAGTFAAIMLIGGVIGCVVFPVLSDKLRSRKRVIIGGFLLSIPGLIGIILFNDSILLSISFFLLGLSTTGVAPVLFQYGAEITRPAPEGTSNGLFSIILQGSVFIIFFMNIWNKAAGGLEPVLICLTIFTIIGIALLFFIKESPYVQGKDSRSPPDGEIEAKPEPEPLEP